MTIGTIACIIIGVCLIKWLGGLFLDLLDNNGAVRGIIVGVIAIVLICSFGFWNVLCGAVILLGIGYVFG